MVAATYSTDLSDVTTANSTSGWSALGGGSSGLGVETDYFIEGTSCISKAGFTNDIKGMIFSLGSARTFTNGEAVFIWVKQNNRNLMNATSVGGTQVLVGNNSNAFKQFYVDGDDSEGSDLAGWRTYAVDPRETESANTGSPNGTYSWFGCQWNIGGSGSLKGSPNGIDAIRTGGTLTIEGGDASNGYATFDGASDTDSTNAWGIIVGSLGTFLFHGRIALGATTAVDFRDSNKSLTVLDDPFVPAAFNQISLDNGSAEWTNIQISHLGTQSPTTLDFSAGTITAEACRFDACGTTTASSADTFSNCTWANSGQIVSAGADFRNSAVSGFTGTTAGALLWNVNADTDGKLDGMSFSKNASNNQWAIRFGTNTPSGITLRNIDFTGYSASSNNANSHIRVDQNNGTFVINLVGCTTDAGTISVSSGGATIQVNQDPVTTQITVIDAVTKTALQNVRVLVEAGTGGPISAGTDIISGVTNASGQISDSGSYLPISLLSVKLVSLARLVLCISKVTLSAR
jgi:hypothetical protein